MTDQNEDPQDNRPPPPLPPPPSSGKISVGESLWKRLAAVAAAVWVLTIIIGSANPWNPPEWVTTIGGLCLMYLSGYGIVAIAKRVIRRNRS